MKYLNEHERELENEGHIETPASAADSWKPRISKKMRAMLKSSSGMRNRKAIATSSSISVQKCRWLAKERAIS